MYRRRWSTKAQLTIIIKKTTKTYYNLSYRLCVKNLKIESNQEKEEKKTGRENRMVIPSETEHCDRSE